MTHTIDSNDPDGVGDLIDHAVISHADTPIALPSHELTATIGARIFRQRENGFTDAAMDLRREAAKTFPRDAQ